MPALIILGVSGSGKTTVARGLADHYGYDFLDADDFHSIEAKAQMASGIPLTDAQREPWVATLAKALQDSERQGRSSVLAFSGLRAAHRQTVRDSGVPMRFIFLHAAPEQVAARLKQRSGHFMPANLLASQYEALQLPDGEADVLSVEVDGHPAQVLARAISALAARAS
ncbi:gluconokinase [Pseudoxanthomonas indica]|uniref:Gluconokinase n=1 Tax=Pseudoxanthomonas indica TaxID=428993 RepID=A0A1T5LN32_9GAMM|nr:gluconokinase, GntK/IdnK-type [Pseudoxanthomonas indica]GGD37245.1 gluconokinase [Pseudoxanthomonas indica]SKC77407.1 gluconate kinase, SKI family [Pseudoxanthomonas indica]